MLHDLQGLGSLTTIWLPSSEAWDKASRRAKAAVRARARAPARAPARSALSLVKRASVKLV